MEVERTTLEVELTTLEVERTTLECVQTALGCGQTTFGYGQTSLSFELTRFSHGRGTLEVELASLEDEESSLEDQESSLEDAESKVSHPQAKVVRTESRLPDREENVPSSLARLPIPKAKLPFPKARLPFPKARLPFPKAKLAFEQGRPRSSNPRLDIAQSCHDFIPARLVCAIPIVDVDESSGWISPTSNAHDPARENNPQATFDLRSISFGGEDPRLVLEHRSLITTRANLVRAAVKVATRHHRLNAWRGSLPRAYGSLGNEGALFLFVEAKLVDEMVSPRLQHARRALPWERRARADLKLTIEERRRPRPHLSFSGEETSIVVPDLQPDDAQGMLPSKTAKLASTKATNASAESRLNCTLVKAGSWWSWSRDHDASLANGAARLLVEGFALPNDQACRGNPEEGLDDAQATVSFRFVSLESLDSRLVIPQARRASGFVTIGNEQARFTFVEGTLPNEGLSLGLQHGIDTFAWTRPADGNPELAIRHSSRVDDLAMRNTQEMKHASMKGPMVNAKARLDCGQPKVRFALLELLVPNGRFASEEENSGFEEVCRPGEEPWLATDPLPSASLQR